MSYGYVYLVTNLFNGKTYVGQRRSHRDSDWNEYFGSGKLIQAAIEFYGKDNFRKDLLTHAESQDELDELESSFIISEWEAGRGEYNLRSFVPSPNSWTQLPSGRLVEKMDKWRKSRKISGAKKAPELNPSHQRALTRWTEFLERTKEEDFEKLYDELGSVKKVADRLNESPRHVGRILGPDRVSLNSRKIKGFKRSLEEKRNIQAGVRKESKLELCGFCFPNEKGKPCAFHRKELREKRILEKLPLKAEVKETRSKMPSEEEIIQCFNNSGSMRKVSDELKIHRRKVREVLVKNGMKIPAQSTVAARAAYRHKPSN